MGHNQTQPLRWVALFVVVLHGAAAPTMAHKRFARKEGVECRECHDDPAGGGPRNLIGQYYQAASSLPIDRSPTTMKAVEDTVDRWMWEVLAKPPTVRWPHTALSAMTEAPPATVTPAPSWMVLRRLSMDLRGGGLSESEVKRLENGTLTVEGAVDEFIASSEFQSTFTLYHKDIVRPRTGIFNTSVSLTKVATATVDADTVYSSEALRGELTSSACTSGRRKTVSPWWSRKKPVLACEGTAREDISIVAGGVTYACDTEAGQRSGQCGCGPHMVFCYPDGIRDAVVRSQKEEVARWSMELVNSNTPYTELLTSDWTMLDGKLEVFYAKLWGKLGTLKDPDADRGWHRVQRSPEHSGVLSSPQMLNFFYNGRRWAERVMEAFMCHEVTPDFNFFDDIKDTGVDVAVAYRDSPDLMPSLTVTQGRACAACHMQLDAVARAKDRWDPFGAYYEKMPTERALAIPQQPIFEGKLVDGLDGFGAALAQSETFHDCVVSQAWEHMSGHRFRPSETAFRRELVARFRNNNFRFKSLIHDIATSPQYQSLENQKLMNKELYSRAMGRSTDVAWKVGDKSGWETYYDKLGAMDYRKIEFRDKRPGFGHMLAQTKGAGESCAEMVTREEKRERKDRLWLSSVDAVNNPPSNTELEAALQRLHARGLGRPWSTVPAPQQQLYRDLFARVSKQHSPADGYRAVCTLLFASEEYAVF
jgi:Protein of unknown function (DUF1585)